MRCVCVCVCVDRKERPALPLPESVLCIREAPPRTHTDTLIHTFFLALIAHACIFSPTPFWGEPAGGGEKSSGWNSAPIAGSLQVYVFACSASDNADVTSTGFWISFGCVSLSRPLAPFVISFSSLQMMKKCTCFQDASGQIGASPDRSPLFAGAHAATAASFSPAPKRQDC